MIGELEFRKIIGDSIRRLRTDKKYSTEKLAELSDTDYSSINQIENGKQNPKSYTLYKILHCLDVNIIDKLITQSAKQANLEEIISRRIKVMSEEELLALQKFIEEFNIYKR